MKYARYRRSFAVNEVWEVVGVSSGLRVRKKMAENDEDEDENDEGEDDASGVGDLHRQDDEPRDANAPQPDDSTTSPTPASRRVRTPLIT